MNKIAGKDNRKLSYVVLAMLQLLVLAGAEAADVYALFNYRDRSEVHLAFSSQTTAAPSGILFFAHPANAFQVDELNRFRLAFFNQPDSFKPLQRRLHRQVFDGLPALADMGAGGHAQHQDQRDLLVAEQSGRPVFRSRGAPFSPGPGFMVTQQLAQQGLAHGEIDIVQDKNWYEIPNSSWYQTWFPEGAGGRLSYTIFYDRWEEQTGTVCESIWKGFPVSRAEDKTIGKYVNYRLRRAKVDGAMELSADKHELVTEITQSSRVAVLQFLATASASVKSAIYTWSGDGSGSIFTDDQKFDCEVIFESRHEQTRFPAMLGENQLIVMGTDLLHRWLQSQSLRHENSECTFSVLVPAGNSRHALFIYSAPDNSLYRFFIDENAIMEKEIPQITSLAFVPSAMTADQEGNLVLGGFSVWPLSVIDDEDLLISVEAIDLTPANPGARTIMGSILLAQQFYFNIYRSSPESVEPVWRSRLNVGRHLHRCDFSLTEQSESITNDVRELIRLARRNGNSLSAPARQSEQAYPGQFVLPDQVLMAVSR